MPFQGVPLAGLIGAVQYHPEKIRSSTDEKKIRHPDEEIIKAKEMVHKLTGRTGYGKFKNLKRPKKWSKREEKRMLKKLEEKNESKAEKKKKKKK